MFSIVIQIWLKIKSNDSQEDFSPYIDRVAETWSPFVIEGATSSLSAYCFRPFSCSKKLFVHKAQSESTIAFWMTSLVVILRFRFWIRFWSYGTKVALTFSKLGVHFMKLRLMMIHGAHYQNRISTITHIQVVEYGWQAICWVTICLDLTEPLSFPSWCYLIEPINQEGDGRSIKEKIHNAKMLRLGSCPQLTEWINIWFIFSTIDIKLLHQFRTYFCPFYLIRSTNSTVISINHDLIIWNISSLELLLSFPLLYFSSSPS